MNPKKILTRRNALITGVAGLGALLFLPRRNVVLPPTHGNILRMGDLLTYRAHRALLPGDSLAREYSRKEISSFPATGTTNPGAAKNESGDEYRKLQSNAFSDWKLSIEGLVARPGSYSLADLKHFPSRTQITKHVCEEGWSAIAEWTGLQLGHVLNAAGILPNARVVNFVTYDGWTDGFDLIDALHPQTLLAYGMNGRDLTIPHGAPVRLRVETQVGYRSMKYLKRVIITDSLDFLTQAGVFKSGWAWYGGI